MNLGLFAGLCALLPFLSACASAPAATTPPASATNLRVSAADDAAQARFAEGLVWCYAYHHAEATRCFEELLALDPSCAMGHWGLAYAAGPHINNMEMSEESARTAHEHTLAASALAPHVALVERALIEALAEYPDHPQGCHLHIHAVEASREPGHTTAAADRSRNRIPYAGHLVHMPSHIDIRTGRYADAIEANQRGIVADEQIIARTGREGFYEVYRAHNYHFIAYAAMIAGREDVALSAARVNSRQRR